METRRRIANFLGTVSKEVCQKCLRCFVGKFSLARGGSKISGCVVGVFARIPEGKSRGEHANFRAPFNFYFSKRLVGIFLNFFSCVLSFKNPRV